MRRYIYIPIITVVMLTLLCSCAVVEECYEVELYFAERSPWEHAADARLWYLVRYLVDDGDVEELYVQPSADRFSLFIPKGVPCIVAAYPLGRFSPVGVCVQPDLHRDAGCPGPLRLGLSGRAGPVAEGLLSYHAEFEDLFWRIDAELLTDSIWDGTNGHPWAVDWGNLYFELIIVPAGRRLSIESNRFYPVRIRDVSGGYWICDHRGVPVASVLDGGGDLNAELPVGTYCFFNPEEPEYLLYIMIMHGGECISWHEPVPGDLYRQL